jgi:hypothetical protein
LDYSFLHQNLVVKIKKKDIPTIITTFKTLRLCVKNKNLPKIIESTCSYFQNLRLVLDTTPIFQTLAMLCPFFVSKSKGDAALKQKKRGRVARAPLQSCFYQLFRLFLISKRRVKNGVAHAVSSCGVLFWTWGVSLSVMGRFAAGPGGRASSLPAMVWCHRTYGHVTLGMKVT